jgi:hypothetical protein
MCQRESQQRAVRNLLLAFLVLPLSLLMGCREISDARKLMADAIDHEKELAEQRRQESARPRIDITFPLDNFRTADASLAFEATLEPRAAPLALAIIKNNTVGVHRATFTAQEAGLRWYFQNPFYGVNDGTFLYCLRKCVEPLEG